MKIQWLALSLGMLVSSSSLASPCSCTAPDGSCSTSVDCPGGCGAFCGEGGFCKSSCYATTFSSSTSASNVDSIQFSSIVSKSLDQEIYFEPVTPGWRMSFDFKDASLAEIMNPLEKRGALELPQASGTIVTRIRLQLPAKEIPETIALLSTNLHATIGIEDVTPNGATLVIRGEDAKSVVSTLRSNPKTLRLLLDYKEQ